MELRSPAFGPNEELPKRYTLDGERISPPLEWSEVPETAKELVLKLEDLDAREPRPFILWIAYKIPARRGLPEGIKHQSVVELEERIMQAMNSMEGTGYQPPAAPYGRRHRLMFHLYAVDKALPDRPGLHWSTIQKELQGHVLAEATLSTFYVREER